MTDNEKRFNQVKKDIISQLQLIKYNGIHIDDIGNEIGIAISKHVNSPTAYEDGMSLNDFKAGLDHGVELSENSTKIRLQDIDLSECALDKKSIQITLDFLNMFKKTKDRTLLIDIITELI